jgi:hypothetical protein
MPSIIHIITFVLLFVVPSMLTSNYLDGKFVELDQWRLIRCIIRLECQCQWRFRTSVTEVGEAFSILHFLDVELLGGVVLLVGVLELLLEDVPFEVAPTKLAIAGPGKTYGADVSKTSGSKIPGSLSL